jgi:hypothetical protein
MITGAGPVTIRGWPRRKVALLGFALMLPLLAILALTSILGNLFVSVGLLDSLFVLGIPFMFVGIAGSFLLLAAWFTLKGKRPFVDPIKLW